jgi:hypothetical protein
VDSSATRTTQSQRSAVSQSASLSVIQLPENSPIVHPKYIEKHTSKKDLVRLLYNLVQVLRKDESIEAESPEWPGLAATAQLLVTKFLKYRRDKEVRLYAVLACMEIFTIVRIRIIVYQ